MRWIAAIYLLIGTACGAEPVTNSKPKFHPTQIDVVGEKIFAPEQIEHELSWQSGMIEKSYENSEPSVIADYLREIVAAAYRQKWFLDVSVNVALTAESRFRIQIEEGSKYQSGGIEIVGAKELMARTVASSARETVAC
jgi:hypothetical protein